MIRLFVYGIFLEDATREAYGMTNARYATVRGWKTVGGHIVKAVPDDTATLTGLLVNISEINLPAVDSLEAGYDRITITTTMGHRAYMYAERDV